jgi:hypothetical protein
MARRFYNVLRGYRGEAAKAKFLDLKGLGQGEKIGTGGNRPDSKKLYVQPYTKNLGPTLYLEVSALDPSYEALKIYAEVASRSKTSVTGTNTSVKIDGFRAARLVRRGKTKTGVQTTSKLTGLKYLAYKSPSVSVPLGRKGPDDTPGETIDDITIEVTGNYSISFLSERL